MRNIGLSAVNKTSHRVNGHACRCWRRKCRAVRFNSLTVGQRSKVKGRGQRYISHLAVILWAWSRLYSW